MVYMKICSSACKKLQWIVVIMAAGDPMIVITYYDKFFKNNSKIKTPLTKLLEKEAFSWIQDETKYFKKLEDMCKTPILPTLNFTEKLLSSGIP